MFFFIKRFHFKFVLTTIILILVIPFNSRAQFKNNFYYKYFTGYSTGLYVLNYSDEQALGIAINPPDDINASFHFIGNKDVRLDSGQYFKIKTTDI
jgi:hypothetical protein